MVRSLIHFAEDSDTSGYFPALAKHHDRARYRMTFATLKPIAPWLRDFMEAQGVRTFSCDARSRLAYPAVIVALAARLRRERPDILHAHLFDPSVVGLTAAWLAGVPTRVLTRHYSNYHTRINRPVHVKLDQWCTALSHRVIAVSRETAGHLVHIEHAPARKVVAIHNGIDFERVVSGGPSKVAALRAELKLEGRFTFLVAGRLHPEKGYPHLFDAVASLDPGLRSSIQVLIAGTGPFFDEFAARIAALDLAGTVRLLGFRHDLPDLMCAADAFLLPSVAESFGLVLAEALYLGVPVLATNTGGIPEIVDDGVDGVLVPPADPARLAAAMRSFAERRIVLPGRGAAALQKVRERFEVRSMVRRYESVYEELPSRGVE